MKRIFIISLYLLSLSYCSNSMNIYAFNSSSQINSNANESSPDLNVELNGQIGPYDPTEGDTEDPFYDYNDEVVGEFPDNFYTISVSVPLEMEFTVFEHSINVKGQFYSPKYAVLNQATRPVHVYVSTVDNIVPTTNDSNYIPLYLEQPVEGDGKVQIDLNLGMDCNSIYKNVNLTNFSSNALSSSNYLGVIGLKEQAILQLNSTSWDRPKAEGFDKTAKVDFKVQLIFSLEEPSTP